MTHNSALRPHGDFATVLCRPFNLENFNLDEFLDKLTPDVDYHILSEVGPFYTRRLNEYAVMNFLHQNNTKDYGLFLYENNAKTTNILNIYDKHQINSRDKAFADQLWYNTTDLNSSIVLTGRGFSSSNRTRGISYDKPKLSLKMTDFDDISIRLHSQTIPDFSKN